MAWPDEVNDALKRDHATTPEPPPKENTSRPIWELVIEDMGRRDHEGRRRYGTPLQAGNGRDALVDAYQEALDLCVYLRQAIEERPKPVMVTPEDALVDAYREFRAQLAQLTLAQDPPSPPPSPPLSEVAIELRALICKRCEGCGKVANDANGSPWTAWAELPPGSDMAVRLGIVKPTVCPDCGGSGVTKP
jgi:hypothetical protein